MMNARTRIFCALIALPLLVPVLARAQDAADSDRVWVTVTGFGASDEEARRSAWATAVSQVVGTLVDSETVIENDQLIRDEVLEFSDGYIETFNILSRTEEDGVVTLQMEALVRRNMVRRRLRELAVIEVAVDGLGLAAQIQTRHQRARDARAMLSRALEPFVEAKYISFRDLRQQEISLTDRGALVPYRVEIGIDQDAYRETAAALLDTLDSLGIQRFEVPLRIEDSGEIRVEGTVREAIAARRIEIPDRGMSLTVQRGMSAFVHAIPPDFVDSEFIERHFAEPALIVRLSLVDSHDVEIIALDQCLGERSSTPPCDQAANRGVRGIFGEVTAQDGQDRALFLTGLNAGPRQPNLDRRCKERFEVIGFDVEVTIPQAERVHRARVTLEPYPSLDRQDAPSVAATSESDQVITVARTAAPDEEAAPSPRQEEPAGAQLAARSDIQQVPELDAAPRRPDPARTDIADKSRPKLLGKRLHVLVGGGVGFLDGDSVTGGLDALPGPTAHVGVRYDFTPHVGLMLMGGWAGNGTDHEGWLNCWMPRVKGSITLLPSSRIRPYLRLGMGLFILDHDHPWPQHDRGAVAAGLWQALGLDLALSRSFSIHLQQDFRHFFPSEHFGSGSGLGISAGVSFAFLERP